MLSKLLFLLVTALVFQKITVFFVRNSFFANKNKRKLRYLFPLLVVFCLFICKKHSFYMFLSLFGLGFAYFVFVNWFLKYEKQIFEKKFAHFIEKLNVYYKCGTSLAVSLQSVFAESDDFLQHKLRKSIEFVLFSQQKAEKTDVSQELLETTRRLQRAKNRGELCAGILENWRKELKVRAIFRRKSGQIILNCRIQSAIMWVLLVSTLVFALQIHGFKEVKPFAVVAVPWFCAAQLFIQKLVNRWV